MKNQNVTKVFKNVGKYLSKRSPEILTGIGIAGMCTTVVLAVKATPKALKLIEEEERIKAAEMDSKQEKEPLTKLETVKVAWKPYIPAIVTGVASIGCLIGASSVNARRNAALYSAYKLSETALTEYKDKVVETIGEEKEKQVRDKIAKDKVEKNPATKTEIFVTGKGESLFYDPLSDRYFTSDIEAVKKVINQLNWDMQFGSEMYASLSQLYDGLGLKHTKISDDIGWCIEDGLIEPDFSAQISDDGRPCLVMDFLKVPKYDFDRYY